MPHMFRRAFLVAGIGFGLLFLFLPGYTKVQELRDRNTDLQSKIKRLAIENTLLIEQLKRIENDPVYQEWIAREKMGVVRKGEIPVKVVPQQNQ
jgi:cell division protein FtsB